MVYNPKIHHRKSIRLKGYDYASEGAYFITIRSWNRECIFGKIENGIMVPNDFGRFVIEEWNRTSLIRKNVELDEFALLPNHLHGIIIINSSDETQNESTVGAYCICPNCIRPNCIRPTVCPDPSEAMQASGNDNSGVSALGERDLQQTRFPEKGEFDSPLRSPSRTIGSIVRGFKSATTKQINLVRGTPGCAVWQRNYHDHIIRNEKDLRNIQAYINNNPMKWALVRLTSRGGFWE